MPRKLAPDEAALWSRVAASVRPLKHRPRVKAPLAALEPPPPDLLPKAGETRRGLVGPVDGGRVDTRRPALPPAAATLDGHWDRDIRRGRLVPERAIDLHGYGREAAYDLLSDALRAAADDGSRVLLVITGKGARGGAGGRGVIRSALPQWLETPALRPFVAALRPAHPRHGGGGAFYVVLRRNRSADRVRR